jgi:hypothetical protein
MPFLGKNLERYAGRTVDNGQCVRFLQVAADVPHTSHWRRGVWCKAAIDLDPGTAIATFGGDPPRYENHTGGRSHAAFLVSAQSDGLLVWDQWVGHPVAQRVIRYRNGPPTNAINDGEYFYTIETDVDDN